MAAAVIRGAAHVSRVHPGGWLHVATVLAAVLGNSAGLISLMGAAAIAAMGARLSRCDHASFVVRILQYAASVFVATLACLTALQLFLIRPWLGWALLSLDVFILVLVVPAAVAGQRLTAPAARLDVILAVYLAGELVLLFVLSRQSDGAWVNYAMQAIVFAAVVTARAVSRRSTSRPHRFLL